MARGKRYRAAYDRIDRNKAYDPADAVTLLKETSGAGFDETVELHILLGVNVRHAEEQLRGTLALPRGLGQGRDDRRLRRGRPGAARPPRPAPSTSAARTSQPRSKRAGPTSTSPSRPRR